MRKLERGKFVWLPDGEISLAESLAREGDRGIFFMIDLRAKKGRRARVFSELLNHFNY
jgi:hypothetical protein